MGADHRAALGVAAAFALVLFVALGRFVAARPPTRIDVEAAAWYGRGTGIAIFFTTLGRWYAVCGVALAAALAAVVRRGAVTVVVELFVAQVLAQGAANALKRVYGRPRPDDWLHRLEHGFSYPSGHAVTAIVFFFGLFLVMLRWGNTPHWGAPIVLTVLGACVVGIPWSRIALGAHYATDVVGGLLLGAAWLCACGALLSDVGAAVAL